jgi:hypothetical protein
VFEELTDPQTGENKKVQHPPGYQFFTCPAAAPKGNGYNLFASSRFFCRYLPVPWSVEPLVQITWAMDNDGFWNAKLKDLPLISDILSLVFLVCAGTNRETRQRRSSRLVML